LLDLGERLDFARLLARLPRLETPALSALPLDEWLGQQGFGAGLEGLVRALVRLTSYGGDPARQSAGAALQQLRLGAEGGVVYLDRGWQTLVDGLSAVLRDAGSELRSRSRVTEVEPEAGGWSVWTRDGRRFRSPAVILAGGPAVSRLVSGPAGATLAGLAEGVLPVRVATMDVALRHLPRPRARFALGVDRPEYLSVHSAAARLAPGGTALVLLARYLGSEPAPPDTRVGLERLLDALQPGWREWVVACRFVPELRVSEALVTASRGGLAGRPGVAVPGAPGLFLAGDWVGDEGQLADASLASGRAAALSAVATLSDAAAA
jgi:phytoene dehydrogenase-like protein